MQIPILSGAYINIDLTNNWLQFVGDLMIWTRWLKVFSANIEYLVVSSISQTFSVPFKLKVTACFGIKQSNTIKQRKTKVHFQFQFCASVDASVITGWHHPGKLLHDITRGWCHAAVSLWTSDRVKHDLLPVYSLKGTKQVEVKLKKRSDILYVKEIRKH